MVKLIGHTVTLVNSASVDALPDMDAFKGAAKYDPLVSGLGFFR
jgi:hypothetical protein